MVSLLIQGPGLPWATGMGNSPPKRLDAVLDGLAGYMCSD